LDNRPFFSAADHRGKDAGAAADPLGWTVTVLYVEHCATMTSVLFRLAYLGVTNALALLRLLSMSDRDRVAIYLPMIPEAVVAMLACARIGATHSVVFGGYSVDALATRIQDAGAKVVITADGGYRRGKPSALKPTVDDAVAQCPSIEHVLVVRRTGDDVAWGEKDLWWHETVEQASDQHEPQAFDSEHPLFILYTSGTTGKPKGILHTTGGYLTQVSYTHWAVRQACHE
jgi:acetyl-CoA synthetase